MLAENAGEVARVLETRGVGGFGDRSLGIAQEGFGPFETHGVSIFGGCYSKRAVELPAEMRVAETQCRQ